MKAASTKQRRKPLRQSRGYLLLCVCWLCTTALSAQVSDKPMLELRIESIDLQRVAIGYNYSLPLITKPAFPVMASYLPPTLSNAILQRRTDIPNLHRYEHLPIFCKIEVKMEQAVRFPIKIRLGEVEYVDRLEGKR